MTNETQIFQIGHFIYKTDQASNIFAYELKNDDSSGSESSSLDSEKSYEEKRIGTLEVESDEQGDVWLNHVEVKPGYRRKKIATKMLELAIIHLQLIRIACVKENSSYYLSLSEEGENFIAGCLRKNIIKPKMCHFSRSTQKTNDYSTFILAEDEKGELLEDPCFDSLIVATACGNFKEKPKSKLITDFFIPKDKTSSDSGEENDDMSNKFTYQNTINIS